ncbi:hypothetical protein A2U01_0068311, partial [Trifolium medium]|nr:hypothetical protein [Trifolium medium]
MAIIHASSVRASSTFAGSVIEISPKSESCSLKLDLVLLGLSLFPRINSSGCDDLYLNVLLSCSSSVSDGSSDSGGTSVFKTASEDSMDSGSDRVACSE